MICSVMCRLGRPQPELQYQYGYVKSVITVKEILGSYDDHFLGHPVKTIACKALHHLLPVAKCTKYALRVAGHDLSLEHVLSELHKRTSF